MESTLYQSIFAKGEARGEARSCAQTILRILTHRMGALDPSVRERIQALSDVETLTAWYNEALLVVDSEGARRLVAKIQNTSLPAMAP